MTTPEISTNGAEQIVFPNGCQLDVVEQGVVARSVLLFREIARVTCSACPFSSFKPFSLPISVCSPNRSLREQTAQTA